MQHGPAIEATVVDTTGCGDVFHGAYAATLAAGEMSRRPSASPTYRSRTESRRSPGGCGILPGWPVINQYLRVVVRRGWKALEATGSVKLEVVARAPCTGGFRLWA